MVSRSLFEVFLLMRNNALQSRHLYTSSKQGKRGNNRGRSSGGFISEDRVALVSDHDHDRGWDDDDDDYGGREDRDFVAEQVGSALRYRRIQNLPPEWVEIIDEVQGQIETIQKKVKELKSAHDRVIKRPAFDDDEADTGRELETATREITQLFQRCHARIGHISRQQQTARSKSERKLAENAALRLTRELQEVSVEFKISQVAYLKQLQAREERSQLFMATGGLSKSGSSNNFHPSGPTSQQTSSNNTNKSRNILLDDDDNAETILLSRNSGGADPFGMGQSQSYQSLAQLQQSHQNIELARERDQEIDRIVRSIEELNSIFKDVSAMIHDQGTVLDRIDYNVQQTAVKVESAHKSLVKAEKYQKQNKKMMVILVLTGLLVLLIIALILKLAW